MTLTLAILFGLFLAYLMVFFIWDRTDIFFSLHLVSYIFALLLLPHEAFLLVARQHPRDLVMAHLPLHQLRQPCRRRCSKRTDQVVSVQVKQGIVHYIHLRCSSPHKFSFYGPYRVR
jgi:hypothetical protein